MEINHMIHHTADFLFVMTENIDAALLLFTDADHRTGNTLFQPMQELLHHLGYIECIQ